MSEHVPTFTSGLRGRATVSVAWAVLAHLAKDSPPKPPPRAAASPGRVASLG